MNHSKANHVHLLSLGAFARFVPVLGLAAAMLLLTQSGPTQAQESGELSSSEVVEEVRRLSESLGKYESHQSDVAELNDILNSYQATSEQVDSLESGVTTRGGGLRAPVVGNQIAGQISRTKALNQRMAAKRYEAEQEILDQAVESSKASYDESKEQFRLALRILQSHMDRQSQAVQKLTSN